MFNPPLPQHRIFDRVVNILFGGFRRWDAVYFLHIAEHGYSYENSLAFFPLFPLSVRATASTLFFPLQYYMNYSSVLLIAAVVVNIVFFVLSAMVLFELSKLVLGNEQMAYRAAQLYCVNPASIFFSACYSESVFALITWLGMLLVERNKLTMAALCFAFSGAARSNGLVNIGFILYKTAVNLFLDPPSSEGVVSRFASVLLPTLLRIVISVSPFLAYQYYAYLVFCNTTASYSNLPDDVRRYGTEQGYRMPYMGPSTWCHYSLPVSYSYIQESHWNVGLFRYYEAKQIPNFVLATPISLLATYAVYLVLSRYPKHCICLGLRKVVEVSSWSKKTDDPIPVVSTNERCLPSSCFVYIVHLAFLLVFGVLFMHVQVITAVVVHVQHYRYLEYFLFVCVFLYLQYSISYRYSVSIL